MDDAQKKELARLVEQQRQLTAQQHLKVAEMVRACVALIRMDPMAYRIRGHESVAERAARQKENREQKALVPCHLEALATQLEDAAAFDITS